MIACTIFNGFYTRIKSTYSLVEWNNVRDYYLLNILVGIEPQSVLGGRSFSLGSLIERTELTMSLGCKCSEELHSHWLAYEDWC